jgi:ATP-dependent Lhr-like helicase
VQTADGLFAMVRQAAPFADLTRSTFERVLDMLSGKYASDDFADLKPRITWDRLGGSIKPREGAQRVAILNGGTIPDRGLYGVFLVGAPKGQGRVGELDEEMVFESRPGETFVLGASTWRITSSHRHRWTQRSAVCVPVETPSLKSCKSCNNIVAMLKVHNMWWMWKHSFQCMLGSSTSLTCKTLRGTCI